MKMVGAAEFKAHCLRIMAEVERTGEPVTVTKRGKPIVVVSSSEVETVGPAKPSSLLGCMKGSVTGYDRPFDPAAGPEDWDAVRGEWEPRG